MLLDISAPIAVIMMVCSVLGVLGAIGKLIKTQGEDIAVLKSNSDDHKKIISQHATDIRDMKGEWVTEIRKIREAFARMEGRVGKIFEFNEK